MRLAFLFSVLFSTLSTACVSALPPASDSSVMENYGRNRAMDARDIVNATILGGIPVVGLKVYAGPIGLGLFYAPETAAHGVIGAGEIGLKHGESGDHNLEDQTLILTIYEASESNARSRLRGKNFDGVWNDNPAYYSRLGVAGACLFGFRLEANPGELVDFMLGLFRMDIYNDDVYKQEQSQAQ